MANAKFDNISVVKRVDLQTITTSQTVRVNVRDEVAKVLTCSVESIATTCECLQGEGVINGRTNVKLLYLDQTGDVCSTNCNADFTNTVQGDVTPNSCMQAVVSVLESKASCFGNVITVEILLEVASSVYLPQDELAFVEGDMFVKRVDKTVCSNVGCKSICGEVEQQLQTANGIQRVLLADSTVCVNGFELKDGVATVDGKATLNLTYFSDKLCYENFSFDFSQEFVASNLKEYAHNFVTVDVKNTKIKLDIVEGETNDSFTAEIMLCLNVVQAQMQTLSVIEDAYDKQCDFAIETKKLQTYVCCGSESVSKRVSAVLPQQVEGQLLGVSSKRAVVSGIEFLDGRVTVQGIIAFDLLSIDDGEYVSTAIQMPFAENIDLSFDASNCKLQAVATLNAISVDYSKGVKVDADMCFVVLASSNEEFLVIGNIEELPLVDNEKYAVEISIANKGDTLWDLAKGLKMSQDEVLAINPEIASPLQVSTKIVTYNKL